MRSSFRDPWTSHGWQRIKLPPHLCEQPPINHNVHSICHSTNDSSKHCWLCPSYRHTESLWAGPQKYKKETFNNQSKRGLAKREWRDLQKASSHTFRLKNASSFLHLRKHHIYFAWISRVWDFPGGSESKSICLQCGRPRFNPWVGKIPWRRKWQPTPVFLPGKSHGRRSLVGYSPWGRKESDMTEGLHFSRV